MNERPVHIIEYQSRWPHEFRAIARGVRGALGGSARRIDHIGSTSVPCLASKDIIDVQLTVASFDGFDTVATRLAAVGYRQRQGLHYDHLPPGDGHVQTEYEKRYFREPRGDRRTHLHVRADGKANQRYALLFRDYLRAHPPAALAYAETKRRLSRHHNEQSDDSVYFEIKDPVCDMVMAPAEEWAPRVAWQMGESDG
ncbi:hypothetical protein CMK11_13850 [Candidatus Poribacteria bacterium]|nr:hypothetical protein [Candidatus Poribacteria bacterium]